MMNWGRGFGFVLRAGRREGWLRFGGFVPFSSRCGLVVLRGSAGMGWWGGVLLLVRRGVRSRRGRPVGVWWRLGRGWWRFGRRFFCLLRCGGLWIFLRWRGLLVTFFLRW